MSKHESAKQNGQRGLFYGATIRIGRVRGKISDAYKNALVIKANNEFVRIEFLGKMWHVTKLT